MTFVDAQGNETPASNPTDSSLIRVMNEDTGVTQRVLLTHLPAVPERFHAPAHLSLGQVGLWVGQSR
jgi:hypothetical protein